MRRAHPNPTSRGRPHHRPQQGRHRPPRHPPTAVRPLQLGERQPRHGIPPCQTPTCRLTPRTAPDQGLLRPLTSPRPKPAPVTPHLDYVVTIVTTVGDLRHGDRIKFGGAAFADHPDGIATVVGLAIPARGENPTITADLVRGSGCESGLAWRASTPVQLIPGDRTQALVAAETAHTVWRAAADRLASCWREGLEITDRDRDRFPAAGDKPERSLTEALAQRERRRERARAHFG